MAKTYKILVNDGKGTDIQPVRVMQGGEPVRMLAKRGWRFELQDDIKGKSLAPDQVRIKRVGKNLTLMFDGSQRADVVIEDFYAENTDKDKDNGSPKLVGTAENGGMYEYVPQDPAVSSMPAELKDGNTPVIMALGGGPLEGDFVLAGLPLVAAAGGISGWAVAGGAAAAAAAGGGGGGGGAAVVVKPSGQTGFLKHDVTNDTGTSQTDSLTNNANPIYTGVAEKGAKVVVVVHGVSYETTASTTDGSYSVELKNEGKALPDGKYTPTVTVTNSAGNSTVDGSSFTVDGSAENNQPGNQVDPNRSAVIAVTAVSEDTGGNATDFITTDTTVTASGTVTGFSSTGVAVGERFCVQIVDKDGVVQAEEFVTPTSDNKWAMTKPTSVLALGDYTIKAEILDAAGNVVKANTHALTITDTPTGQTGFLKQDAVNDTGASQTDGITMNQNPKYTGFAEKGASVEVEINGVKYPATASSVDGSYTVDVTNNNAKLNDGVYTPKIKVTLNGKSTTVDGTSFTVDHSTNNNQPDNQVDPNKNAVIAVTAVSDDTGGSATDFITADTTVIVSGTVTGFSSTGAAAGERFCVQIVDKDGVVKAEEFVTPTSDNNWAMTTPTSVLALGDYTIKAEIVDVAGNVVKSGEHALKVVDSVLTATPDTAIVREDLTLKADGNLIRGTSSGNGTDVDTNERFETLKIDKIKAGNGSFQNVGSETTITGTFGDLALKADGTYTYTLKNTDAKVQALTNTGTTGLDEFTYEVTNSKGQRSSTTLKVTVNGTDDTAVITLPLKQFNVASSGFTTLGSTAEVKDADAGENKLDVLANGSQFTGSFSIFEIKPSTTGTHDWIFDKPATPTVAPSASVNRHDLYTMNSKDGSASVTLDFVIKATSTVTAQEFHTSTLKGLKVEASTENTTDTLVLRGQQLEFDFTGDVATKDIKSIEKVDITGGGSNTIKLSLDSLVQADTVSLVVNGSTLTVHRLFIEGDTNDAVQLNSSLGTSSNHVAPIAGTGALSGYNVYHFDATHELLIQQSITSITFAG